MATTYESITVQMTATLIVASNNARTGLILYNNSTSDVFIGPDTSITTENTVLLNAKSSLTLSDKFAWKGAIYGIVASGTSDVRYWETEE